MTEEAWTTATFLVGQLGASLKRRHTRGALQLVVSTVTVHVELQFPDREDTGLGRNVHCLIQYNAKLEEESLLPLRGGQRD